MTTTVTIHVYVWCIHSIAIFFHFCILLLLLLSILCSLLVNNKKKVQANCRNWAYRVKTAMEKAAFEIPAVKKRRWKESLRLPISFQFECIFVSIGSKNQRQNLWYYSRNKNATALLMRWAENWINDRKIGQRAHLLFTHTHRNIQTNTSIWFFYGNQNMFQSKWFSAICMSLFARFLHEIYI